MSQPHTSDSSPTLRLIDVRADHVFEFTEGEDRDRFVRSREDQKDEAGQKVLATGIVTSRKIYPENADLIVIDLGEFDMLYPGYAM